MTTTTTNPPLRPAAGPAHISRQQAARDARAAARADLDAQRADHGIAPISAETAAREMDQLFPEKIGKVELATLPALRPFDGAQGNQAQEEQPPAFTRAAARRPIERPREPLLQWATGLPTTKRELYAGWFVEAGQDADLDDAMGRAGFAPVAIKHGAGNVVTHWALPVCSFFVVCDGIQTITEMRDSVDRYGIAFGWRSLDGRPQSVLRARVFVQELCAVGYIQPLLLSVKSTLTGDLLRCLIDHYQVLDSINPIRAAAGKPPISVPFYAVAITLGAGSEVQRGSGQTKEITPMTEIGARDRAYVLAHWCRREWVQAIESQVDATIIWSRAESSKIAAGDAPEGE